MNKLLQTAYDYIDHNQQAMISLWKNIVSIESPSSDQQAVGRIAAHLDTYCDAMGLNRKIFSFEKAGPTFMAWTDLGSCKPVALIGHMDTVHPVGSFGSNPFLIDGDTVTGPGVLDCKGGVVAAIYAIRALKAAGYQERQLKLILSGDEEVAHALSGGEGGKIFEQETTDCAAVLNCETGIRGGDVTIRRKGGAIFVIEIEGKAAHAGKEPEKGVSAIRQAAEMILAIEQKTDFSGTTYNCGRIEGGKGANIVPDYCRFTVGIRYWTNAQYEEAEAFLRELCEHPSVTQTRCRISQNGFYPAMEPVEKTDQLLKIYQQCCLDLGLPAPKGTCQGGCSDSAFVARAGIPVLCSLGVAGEGPHTLREWAEISSLAVQCKKMIATILALPEDF